MAKAIRNLAVQIELSMQHSKHLSNPSFGIRLGTVRCHHELSNQVSKQARTTKIAATLPRHEIANVLCAKGGETEGAVASPIFLTRGKPPPRIYLKMALKIV